jgi:hypothetical protein
VNDAAPDAANVRVWLAVPDRDDTPVNAVKAAVVLEVFATATFVKLLVPATKADVLVTAASISVLSPSDVGDDIFVVSD